MRRILVNGLALIGALTVLSVLSGFVVRRIAGSGEGFVIDRLGNRPAGVPVFLDRRGSTIERYVTDSSGAFPFVLSAADSQHAIWLICANGMIPMVGSREVGELGPTAYSLSPLADSTWGSYRAWGWHGPIPRECPRGTDEMGWRFVPGTGHRPTEFSATEPVWPNR